MPLNLRRYLAPDYWASFIKFNLVGASGVAVNEGLFLLFQAYGMYLVYASALAVEVSIVTNFVLNDLWTFRDRRHGRAAARLAKFNGVMLMGLAVNVAVLYAVTEYLGVSSAISELVGIGVASLLRYWLSVKFAWIRKEGLSTEPPEAGLGLPQPAG